MSSGITMQDAKDKVFISGGGGGTYTAGDTIEITEDNVISVNRW